VRRGFARLKVTLGRVRKLSEERGKAIDSDRALSSYSVGWTRARLWQPMLLLVKYKNDVSVGELESRRSWRDTNDLSSSLLSYSAHCLLQLVSYESRFSQTRLGC
jgi:hypothetical protein